MTLLVSAAVPEYFYDGMMYNVVNITRAVIGCCPWSIIVQTHKWRYGKLLFFVLSDMARALGSVCEIILYKSSEINGDLKMP